MYIWAFFWVSNNLWGLIIFAVKFLAQMTKNLDVSISVLPKGLFDYFDIVDFKELGDEQRFELIYLTH